MHISRFFIKVMQKYWTWASINISTAKASLALGILHLQAGVKPQCSSELLVDFSEPSSTRCVAVLDFL